MANHVHNYRNINEALPALSGAVLSHGDEIGSRLGERTKELTQVAIRLERPWERELLLPGRKPNLAAQIIETMWVLAGRDDIDTLLPYLPRAADFSDDGKTWRGAYGPRLRSWVGFTHPIDQLDHVVRLLQEERVTRRAVMAIYDPRIDSDAGKDIPCNDFITFLSRGGELEMHVTVRSNDLWWGFSGINAFEWSALQEIVAHLLGVAPGPLHFSTTSLHLYDRHWKRARELQGQDWVNFDPALPTPRFQPLERSLAYFDDLVRTWWDIEQMIRDESVVDTDLERNIYAFPEPMLRSWLRVVAAWWRRDDRWLQPLEDTRLAYAAKLGLQRKRPIPTPIQDRLEAFSADPVEDADAFVLFASELHASKSAAYGDSWRRRGEQMSIMANIARKVDRLGVSDDIETSADTAVDLLIYLVKYGLWLSEVEPGFDSDNNDQVRKRLMELSVDQGNDGDLWPGDEKMIEALRSDFNDRLAVWVGQWDAATKLEVVQPMQKVAFGLAKRLWSKEQHPSSEGAAIDAWEAAKRIQASHAERNATRSWNPEPDDEPDQGERVDVPDRTALVDLLSVVGVQTTVLDTLTWSPEQQQAVTEWAAATHLAASDNDVVVPPKPEFLP